jgi:tetratricopeptide (TPR) repeat protein
MYPRTLLPLLVCLFLLPRFAAAQSASVDTAEVNRMVDSLLQVSRTLTKQRQYDQALEVNAEAERLALGYLGRESVGYGNCCFNRGRVNYFKGNYQEAENWYLESKYVREKTVGKENSGYANSLNNLAVLYQDMGQYEKAEPLHLEARAIREQALGKEDRKSGG